MALNFRIPSRQELYDPTDTNFAVSDFKVLALARLVVKLKLGAFTDLPTVIRASLKKSVSAFYNTYLLKSKGCKDKTKFVEREQKWLSHEVWLDQIARHYLINLNCKEENDDPDASVAAAAEVGTEAEEGIEQDVIKLEETEDPRILAGFNLLPNGLWEGSFKKIRKAQPKDEDGIMRKKRKYKKRRLAFTWNGESRKRGRPAKTWGTLSEASKRKASYILSSEHTLEELLGAAYHGAHKVYRNDVARHIKQIKEILAGPPMKTLPKPIDPPIPFSSNEAVNWVIDSNMTRPCYQTLRLTSKVKGANIFPNYNHVDNAKTACYPHNIMVNEIFTEIPLQNFLNHTAERIVGLNKEAVSKMTTAGEQLKLNLVLKWGYDSSSGSSEWRQRFLSDSMRDGSDADLFCVSAVPLCLRHPDGVIWQNPLPSSPRFSRPLSIQLGKESPELAYEAQAKVEAQIRDLQPAYFVVDLDEKTLLHTEEDEEADHDIIKVPTTPVIPTNSMGIPTAIGVVSTNDYGIPTGIPSSISSGSGGKKFSQASVKGEKMEVEVYFLLQHTVVEPVTSNGNFGTFTDKDPNCHVCVSDPNIAGQFTVPIVPNGEAHKYVMSLNHAWWVCFECLIHVASFVPQESWAGRSDINARMAQRKVDIQKAFKKELGLIVDKTSKYGQVSKNDAMQISRAFHHEEEFSRLCGIDRTLIHRFNIILSTLVLSYEINSEEFDQYCRDTGDLFGQQYRWFVLPTAVHKILYHGRVFAEEFIIPIGMMSEEAQVARNKDSTSFFRRHAGKESKQEVMGNVMKFMMILGDPMMSMADLISRKEKQNWNCFEEDVQSLIAIPPEMDERRKLLKKRNQARKSSQAKKKEEVAVSAPPSSIMQMETSSVSNIDASVSNIHSLSNIHSSVSNIHSSVSNIHHSRDLSNLSNVRELSQMSSVRDHSNLSNVRDHSNLSNIRELSHTPNIRDQSNISNVFNYRDLASVSNVRDLSTLSNVRDIPGVQDLSNVQDLSVHSHLANPHHLQLKQDRDEVERSISAYQMLGLSEPTSHISQPLLRQHENHSIKSNVIRSVESPNHVIRAVESPNQANHLGSLPTYQDPGLSYHNSAAAKLSYNFPSLLDLAQQDPSRFRNPHPHLVQYAPSGPAKPQAQFQIPATSQASYNTAGTFPVINFPYHQ